MEEVTIKVRTVGQSFGHSASVTLDGRRVHETDVVPWGMSGAAYQHAADWAKRRGYRVRSPK